MSWVWSGAVVGLMVISGGVAWWRYPRRAGTDSVPAAGGVSPSRPGPATRRGSPGTSPPDSTAEVGTRAAAAMVLPVITAGEPSSGALVGRDQELAALLALLDPRLGPRPSGSARVVVSGIAGVGKTALARQAARTAVAQGWFPGGALVVDLHGGDSDPAAQVAPERVYGALLRALDPSLPVADLPATVEEQASAYHQLMSHLSQYSRPVLLVLDNAGSTDQVAGLLPAGRAHRVLITSRHTLGELPGARLVEVDVLASGPAVELLGSRRPGDSRLGAHPAAAAELARLCGHLPLALQTIAVLMADDPDRPAADLVKELSQETARRQAPRWAGWAALEVSYRCLDDPLARLFRLLAMVPGADVAAPAVAVLADQPVERVRQSLIALARAQLLECRRPGRWRMHDQLRVFATEHARAHTQHDGQDQAIARLLGYYRDTTHAAARRLSAGATQVPNGFDTVEPALDWLRSERANLVAAVVRAAGTPAHREHAIDMALGLAPFLDRERYLEDWTVTATAAVNAAAGIADHHREGAALNNLGSALVEVGRPGDARVALEQASALFVELRAYDDADRVVGLLTTL